MVRGKRVWLRWRGVWRAEAGRWLGMTRRTWRPLIRLSCAPGLREPRWGGGGSVACVESPSPRLASKVPMSAL